MTLVLASSSPRRRELLSTLVAQFDIRSPEIDEIPHQGESPVDYVRRIATQKASKHMSSEQINLGADTTVVLEGQIIGKLIMVALAVPIIKIYRDRATPLAI